MSKDPAFLFYPGDYLRDTQCLSEPVQVAYDRIMCEHMRNICISQKTFDFFTKRLSEDQKTELKMVLSLMNGGYCIEWVYRSLIKRRDYSNSRSKNRRKSHDNHMKSYDNHSENENVNVIVTTKADKNKIFIAPTIDEVKAYFLEKGTKIDPIAFFSHYEANGWVQGRNKPIKKWKACLATWEQNNKTFTSSAPYKRICSMVVLEMIAAKKNNNEILQELAGKYTEHEINEAIMKCRNKIV
jgi:hypothetical protein